jgi:hypothetical protein
MSDEKKGGSLTALPVIETQVSWSSLTGVYTSENAVHTYIPLLEMEIFLKIEKIQFDNITCVKVGLK